MAEPNQPAPATVTTQGQQQQQQQQTLMSMAYLRRHRDMTPEQFYEHWEHTHGVIVKPWAEKHGLKYTQIHLKAEHNIGAKPIGPENPPPDPAAAAAGGATSAAAAALLLQDYDGCALFEVPSFDQFAAAFQDEYYKTVIEPDEKKFIDKKVGVMRVRGEVRRITS